jgi:hypothetical protein
MQETAGRCSGLPYPKDEAQQPASILHLVSHVPPKGSFTKYTACRLFGHPSLPDPVLERSSDTPSQERKSQRGKYRYLTFRHALDIVQRAGE